MFLGPGRWRLLPTEPTQPAFAIYQRVGGGSYTPFGIHVLEIEGDRLAAITSFIDPSLPLRFGFPSHIPGEG
jgi:RNA polymerase sigma-70 factor (ECF subfamily)